MIFVVAIAPSFVRFEFAQNGALHNTGRQPFDNTVAVVAAVAIAAAAAVVVVGVAAVCATLCVPHTNVSVKACGRKLRTATKNIRLKNGSLCMGRVGSAQQRREAAAAAAEVKPKKCSRGSKANRQQRSNSRIAAAAEQQQQQAGRQAEANSAAQPLIYAVGRSVGRFAKATEKKIK